jgi:hypothetical protein
MLLVAWIALLRAARMLSFNARQSLLRTIGSSSACLLGPNWGKRLNFELINSPTFRSYQLRRQYSSLVGAPFSWISNVVPLFKVVYCMSPTSVASESSPLARPEIGRFLFYADVYFYPYQFPITNPTPFQADSLLLVLNSVYGVPEEPLTGDAFSEC